MKLDVVTRDQHANTQRAVELVGRRAQRTGAERLKVNGDFSYGLHGIDVQRHAQRAAAAADLGDRLQHAGFVIGEHDADESHAGAEQAVKFVEIDDAVTRHAETVDRPAAAPR